MNKTRAFSLLLALVVLISCLPVIPAVADEIYWLDGTWRFNYDISWDSDFDFFHPSFVTIDDSSYNAFNYIFSESEIWLYNQSDEVCAYDSGEWNGSFPVVVFSERVQVTKDEYDFFQTNLTQTSSPSVTYSTTLNIDGQLFNFFGTGSSPLVEMTVNIDGCTLTDGSSSRQFVYSGSGTFKGFSISSGGSLNYSIGSTWSFGGKSGVDSSYSLFSVVEDDSQPVYSSSITINGVTETFTSTGSAPKISMQVLDIGAVFTAAGKTVPYVYEGEGSFLGFAVTASGEPVFTPGNTYELAAGDHIFYSVGDGSFTTTITIDGQKFIFTSTTEQPAVLLQVTSSGAILSYGDQTLTFTYEGDGNFLGLGPSPLMDPVYLPGKSYSLAAGSYTLYAIASTSGELILSAGQWEANKSLASASNEYVALSAWPDGLTSVPLSFISSGQTFSSMSYQGTIQYGNCLFYGDSRVYGFDTLAAISDPGWKMDAYALVYFATDQSVPEAFYTWFTSNFKYVGSDSVDPIYTTTINIYDMTGVSLLATWSSSASGTCPSFTFTVLDNGILVSGDDTWTWTGAGDPFYGFSFNAGSPIVSFAPGEVSSVSGTAADLTFSLYLVSELSEKVYQTGVLGWFQKLFDMIAELPDKIRKAIFGEDVLNSVNDASSVLGSTGLFRQAYNALYAGWGLRDLLEDPDGPFAWLFG